MLFWTDVDVCKEVQAELLPVFVRWSPECKGGCFSPSLTVRSAPCALSKGFSIRVWFSSGSLVQFDLIWCVMGNIVRFPSVGFG